MIQSMTGFGRGAARHGETVISVEVRGVNARQNDVRIKLPPRYRDAEPGLRAELQEHARRGKVDVTVERRDASGAEGAAEINAALFARYRDRLVALTPAIADDPAGLAQAVLRLPGIVGESGSEFSAGERAALGEAFAAALRDFVAFRRAEGEALGADLAGHARAIAAAIPAVEAFEAERKARMRQRLARLVDENLAGTPVDQNRLEQEVVFYLEKIDIAEEKQRLAQHCDFFLENLADPEEEKGRRLNFIAQEMGREINTLGAKAYSSDIQRVVVAMKESLEKVKEQLANVV